MYKIVAACFLIFRILPAAGQAWHLNTDNDGIKVYTATVPDSKIKAIRVECDFNTTAARLVTVLLDIKTCSEWVYSTRSCTLLKQVSPSELYYHSEINVPWPAQNRDFVAHLTVTQNPETKVIYINGPAVNGMVPVKNGIVRIEHSNSKWVISPVAENKVHVSYILQADPGGDIPAWLINMFITQGPTQSFKKLRLQLKKSAYKDAALPFLKD